jgi:hypothetical protein
MMNRITIVKPRKFSAKVLWCALGLMGMINGGDAKGYDARADPMVPVASPVVVAKAATNKINMTLSDCEGVKAPDDSQRQLGGQLAPAGSYKNYMLDRLKKRVPIDGAVVTILEQPKHGVVIDGRRDKITAIGPTFSYTPNHGFLGQDKVTFLVEVGGKRIKVITTLYVDKNTSEQCEGDAGDVKRISSTNTLDLTTSLAALLTDTQLSGQFANSGITLNFTDLPSAAVGQTTGTSITLDTTAVGNGWFIDTTPADNSEFLPTSNPNEWVAKAGSTANVMLTNGFPQCRRLSVV